MTADIELLFHSFGFWSFGLVSNFGFRYSDLVAAEGCLGVGYSRTSNSHILKLKLRQDIKKEDIKVRLQEGGVLEIEWPRKIEADEIPID